MYQIDSINNQCLEVEKVTFSDLGFREREHLQEWFAKNPSMFGEELLIIQKEFDGFAETRERLDLLAIDKSGNLVIIENKLDDSGRDVTWQSLKYASYCSSLSRDNIKLIYQDYLTKQNLIENAEDNISDFIGIDYDEIILNQGSSQRVILVAANFRREVTSTVIWLMNYNLNIKCIKVTPYKHGEEIFLDVNQIIPVKDIENYTISMMDKQADEKFIQAKNQSRNSLRIKFWQVLLAEMGKKSDIFSRISPKKDNWISVGSGISNVCFSFVVTQSGARVELYFDIGSKEKNEEMFDFFYNYKSDIENKLSNYSVEWQRLEDRNACRICVPIEGNYYKEEQWDILISNMISSMLVFYKTMGTYINKYKGKDSSV